MERVAMREVAGALFATIWLFPTVAFSAEAVCSNPAVWYCFDYEDGTRGPGFSWGSAGGFTNSTNNPFHGSRSLRGDYGTVPRPGDNGGTTFGEVHRSSYRPGETNEFHARWYEYFSPGWKWSDIATKGFIIQARNGFDKWKLYVLNDNGSGRRPFFISEVKIGGVKVPGTDKTYGSPPVFPIGQWVLVEIHLNLSTGVYREWRDGALASNLSGMPFGNVGAGGGLGFFEITGYWNCPSGNWPPLENCTRAASRGQQSRYIDNLVIADGDFMIGPFSGASSPGSPPAPTSLPPDQPPPPPSPPATPPPATPPTTPPPAPPPGTVGDMAVQEVRDTAVIVSFTEVNNGTGSPARYQIRQAAATGTMNWGSANAAVMGPCIGVVDGASVGAQRSCTVKGLQPATKYQFQLVPYRGALNFNAIFGALSNVVTATTIAAGLPPCASATVR